MADSMSSGNAYKASRGRDGRIEPWGALEQFWEEKRDCFKDGKKPREDEKMMQLLTD